LENPNHFAITQVLHPIKPAECRKVGVNEYCTTAEFKSDRETPLILYAGGKSISVDRAKHTGYVGEMSSSSNA
jgi:hypothetical protein